MTTARGYLARRNPAWVCLAISAIALASACSGGGKPPQGTWACTTDAMGAKQTLNTTYAADGKTSGTGTIKVEQPGMAMDLKLSFTGTWKLEGDQLTEQMTDAKIVEGTMNGQPVPDELKSSLVQGMGAQTVSTMKVEGNKMTLTAPGSDATLNCTK
jgi:hypothetical protein